MLGVSWTHVYQVHQVLSAPLFRTYGRTLRSTGEGSNLCEICNLQMKSKKDHRINLTKVTKPSTCNSRVVFYIVQLLSSMRRGMTMHERLVYFAKPTPSRCNYPVP